ncbi:MAG: hypothetical protein ABSF32_12800 [Ignavibacteria bacterium]|jgi:hypothetical protein
MSVKELEILIRTQSDKKGLNELKSGLAAIQKEMAMLSMEQLKYFANSRKALIESITNGNPDKAVLNIFQRALSIAQTISGYFDEGASKVINGFQRALGLVMQIVSLINSISTASSAVSSLLGFIPGVGAIAGLLSGGGRASGGPVSPERPYIVGERGAELFMPLTEGFVIPNKYSMLFPFFASLNEERTRNGHFVNGGYVHANPPQYVITPKETRIKGRDIYISWGIEKAINDRNKV